MHQLELLIEDVNEIKESIGDVKMMIEELQSRNMCDQRDSSFHYQEQQEQQFIDQSEQPILPNSRNMQASANQLLASNPIYDQDDQYFEPYSPATANQGSGANYHNTSSESSHFFFFFSLLHVFFIFSM